ncbi:hypothetical protein BABINDRAFT_27405, partial [Babjeviella inositovora NRRL Y-12698]
DYTNHPLLSSLEAQILTQYQRLSLTLLQLSREIQQLTNTESSALLENLRTLETKLSLVFTLFKGAVYTLFLQQEENVGEPERDAAVYYENSEAE